MNYKKLKYKNNFIESTDICYCKLCMKERLLVESHIIPKFFIKKCRSIQNDNKFEVITNNINSTNIQDGPKEKLLCQACEEKISKYETYYNNFFYEKKGIKIM